MKKNNNNHLAVYHAFNTSCLGKILRFCAFILLLMSYAQIIKAENNASLKTALSASYFENFGDPECRGCFTYARRSNGNYDFFATAGHLEYYVNGQSINSSDVNLSNYQTSDNYYKIQAWHGDLYCCELWIPNTNCNDVYPIAQFDYSPFGNPDCWYSAYSNNGSSAVYHWILDNGRVIIKPNNGVLFCAEVAAVGGFYPVTLTVTNSCGVSSYSPSDCLNELGLFYYLFDNPHQDILCYPWNEENPLDWRFDFTFNSELQSNINYKISFSDGSNSYTGTYDYEFGIRLNHTFPYSGCFVVCIELLCSDFNLLPSDCPTRFCKTICIDGFDCDNIFKANCNRRGQTTYHNSTNPNDNYLFPPTSIMDDHFDCHNLDDGCDITSPLNSSLFRRNEQIYQIDPRNDGYENKNVTIDLCWEDNLDLDLFAYTSCYQDGLNNCAITSTGNNRIGNNEAMFIESATENEYFIVVDGQSNNSNGILNEGPYTLSITCGELCDHDAEPIYCDEPIYSNTYNEFNYASFYCGRCTNENGKGQAGNWGPEKVFYFDVEYNDAEVEIELDLFSDQDLDLYLLSNCDVNSCIANSRRFFGNKEVINVTLNRGRYFIVVEGYKGATSDFELTVKGCKEAYCDLFIPHEGYGGQYIQFDNTTTYECKSYSIYYSPLHNMDQLEMVDSIQHVSESNLEYYCPRPGCYVFCFYYCDQFGNIQRCCVKYCAEFSNWTCYDYYPYVKAYHDNEDESCNVTMGCFYIEDENPDSSYYTINDDVFLPNSTGDLSLTGLPYNEYEICCYSYFAECNYWEVCCKTFCFPFIENDKCLGFEGLVQGTGNSYSSSPRDDNFTFEISPSTGWTVTCTSDFPPSRCTYTFEPGNYRVCYFEIETNRPICCENICIEARPPSEECMDIIPYGNNHLLLRNSNEDHTPICWDIFKKFGDVIGLDQVAHGQSPLIKVESGFEYEICKKYYGCCDEILECCQTVCFEDPLECNYIVPQFLRLNQQDSLEYEFSLSAEAQSQGLIASNWKIDELDLIFQTNGNVAQTSFVNQDGKRYTISVDVYDPVTECHIVCCIPIILSSTVGREELIEEELIIYPNPTTGMIHLEHPFIPEQVKVFSLHGQHLLSFANGELNTINIDHLVNGIYILKVYYDEARIATHRILKQ